ncbi:eukaryotic translation initiation factor 2C [Coprinellus micaceus]|uniref:Eukaryotic translation initiation factor 2C n=1 Tax=Coprinellus micaceus TaxID=71717 RepID=A0A4Y7RJC1_COPMI|nr:eukaryotic translation initiation factor 2C [Coprinellus micaceus]
MPPRAAPRGGPRGGGRGGGNPRGGARGGARGGGAGAGRGGTTVGPTLVSSASHIKTVGVKRDGRAAVIKVLVNAFEATIPDATIHHYDAISPDNLPARLNLQIIKALQFEVAPRKNLFCTARLALSGTDTQEFNVPLPQANGGANPTRPPKVFKVKITLAATINPELLNRFVHGQQSHDDEATTAITACNVALRMEPNMNFPFNTRSFFIEGLEKRAIGAGLELWRGLFQSFRPGPEKVFINVDIATGLMYRQGPLIGLCLEVIGQSNPNYLSPQQGLPDHIRMKLERFIKGVQVIVEGTHHKRVVRGLSRVAANKIMFDNNGRQMSVAQYFQQKLGRPLAHPNVLCAEVGKTAMVPLEVCTVPSGQIVRKQIPPHKMNDVLTFSKKTPDERFEIIRRGIQYLGYGQSQYLSALGINVNTSRGPMEVNGRVLNAPKMIYGQNVQVGPRNGAWNMAQKKLWRPCAPIREWIVVVYENQNRFNNDRVQGMVQGLVTEARNVGITFSSNTPLVRYENGNGNIGEQMKTAGRMLFQQKKVGPTLYVVVLPENGDEIYTAVKHFGDVTQGVATQCLKSNKCARANAQYWANVLLKVNVKLGGVNSIPDPALASSLADPAIPTIVMGADVIHPAPGADGRPSFTALVSSVDRHCAKYIATDRVQEGRREIISDLKEMAVHCLNNYVNYRRAVEKAPKLKPQRLIFFRDGVSEGQFSQVIEQELTLLKKALDECDMKDCKVTFVVVGKRHHIRFKPVNDADKDRSGNAPAGLVVDRDIGHPIEFDFYLQSHGGLLGTSRSSHYSVLYDENMFNADALQALAFSLCHVYARCDALDADIVCARAKTHYDPNQGGLFSDSGTVTSQGAAQNLQAFRAHFKPLSEYAQRHMYFSVGLA